MGTDVPDEWDTLVPSYALAVSYRLISSKKKLMLGCFFCIRLMRACALAGVSYKPNAYTLPDIDIPITVSFISMCSICLNKVGYAVS